MTTPSGPFFSQMSRFRAMTLRRGAIFMIIILGALLAFEIFNFSTTDYALSDVLGDMSFMGLRWATILALAFCGIDFAGIARMFTPEKDTGAEPTEVWYLFGAWLLAATMNAILTWWGVSLSLVNHQMQSSAVIDPALLVRIVPIFVAVMVWLIRILIIGTLSLQGEKLFSGSEDGGAPARLPASPRPAASRPASRPSNPMPSRQPMPGPASVSATSFKPVYRAAGRQEPGRQEPARQEPGSRSRPVSRPSGDRPQPTRPQAAEQPARRSAETSVDRGSTRPSNERPQRRNEPERGNGASRPVSRPINRPEPIEPEYTQLDEGPTELFNRSEPAYRSFSEGGNGNGSPRQAN